MKYHPFQKVLAALVLLAASAACVPGFNLTIGATQTPLVITATAKPIPTLPPIPPSPLPPIQVPTTQPTSQGIDRVKIYLVAVGDNGISGKLIGCGDSLVPVEVQIAPTLGVLRAALNELLKLQGKRYYGQSGLYNALYQSNLTIKDVAVVNGEAQIYLQGTLLLGGECDNPRVEEQLTAIALQFSTVKSVSVFVNGTPLAKLLDLKGQS
jgi:hypothetical protein